MKVKLKIDTEYNRIEGFIQGKWRPVLAWNRKVFPASNSNKWQEMRNRIALNTTGRRNSGLEKHITFTYE